MADFETIKFTKIGGVATITLDRPDAANGINLPMANELLTVAIDCSDDPAVRAVVLTGNGKLFSAGGDVKSFAPSQGNSSSLLKELTAILHAAISRMARMDAPLIVAVNGAAAGAGFSLAVAGDIVLSAKSAKYTMAYTMVGMSPDASASFYLPRLIGLRKAQELMITNRTLSAEEAFQWGAINRVVEDGEVLSVAMALAQQLASGPTRSYGMIKKLLHASFNNGLETQMELESSGIAAMSQTEDGKEGIMAFIEKRAPDFKGR